MIHQLLLETCDLITLKMNEELQVQHKTSKKDLVTNVDKEIEAFLVSRLKQMYPNAKFLGEESNHDVDLNQGEVWLIDPLDGTNNFVRQSKNFGILIAYYKDGVGIEGYMVDVLNKKIYHAQKDKGVTLNKQPFERVYDDDFDNTLLSMSADFLVMLKDYKGLIKNSCGIRYNGSCCIDGINVLEKAIGAYGIRISSPWDIAPHLIFAKELGLVCTNLDGSPKELDSNTVFIFGQKQIVDRFLEYC